MASRTAPAHAMPHPSAVYSCLAVALGASVAFALTRLGLGGGHALFFAIAPDLAFLLSIAPGLARGQLHPRAVGLYNALHAFPGPIVLGAAAALNLFGLDLVWLVGALAWATHIATDRALGFGPRNPEG